jgi:hypothetical protein
MGCYVNKNKPQQLIRGQKGDREKRLLVAIEGDCG